MAKKSAHGATVKCKDCGKKLRLKPNGESIAEKVEEATVKSLVDNGGLSLEEAKLSMADRKSLPKSAFVFPDKAPGSGAYPIHDEGHAKAAIVDSSGKSEEGTVKAAVHAKWPNLGKSKEE